MVSSAVRSATRRSRSAFATVSLASASLRAAISRSSSSGDLIRSNAGATRTRAATVTHDTTAVAALSSPASR